MNQSGASALFGRSILTLEDFSDFELQWILEFAADLKRERSMGKARKRLAGRSIALVFEKPSTRTRCAAVVAAVEEGAHPEYLGRSDLHLGKKESVADTARVLGRLFGGILFRGFSHATVEILARYSGVPVWNGLTEQAHPTQALADLMTLKENFGRLAGLRLAYFGDGRNNVCRSLMLGCAMTGVDFVNCCPPALAPPPEYRRRMEAIAATHDASLTVTSSPEEAVRGADAVYTDVWTSMGEEEAFQERLRLLTPYRVTRELMQASGNLESGPAIFLHCLPALHNRETEITRDLGALEVEDAVFEAPYSKVFEQAENRMHTLKALMLATMTGGAGPEA